MTARIRSVLVLAVAASFGISGGLSGQDTNVLLRVDTIEHRLAHGVLEVADRRDTRFEGDRTQRVMLGYPDSSIMLVKMARAAPGGEAFNNVPRYEVAAYLLQKLFLDEQDYVVPPTVARMVPLEWYRTMDGSATPTFSGTDQVMLVLQYWLSRVTSRDVYDRRRIQSDTSYARHLGNLNVLTYLIRHADSNQGNVIISEDSVVPRMFTVDNGVAFASPESDRGTDWREMRVNRLPLSTAERLRQITRDDLVRVLGTVAEWERRDGTYVPVDPRPSISGNRGVRRSGDSLQIGLTNREISGVHGRLQRLVRQIESGRITVF